MSNNKSEQKRISNENKKEDVLQKKLPLGTLVGNYMILSKIFSKLDRNAYLRLIRTNKTMLNFAEIHKNTIKFNLLRGETLDIRLDGLICGKVIINTATKKFEYVREFKPVCDVFEYSVKGKKKQKNVVSKEDCCKVLRGSCPKELIYASPHPAHYDLIENLALAPGYTMTFNNNDEIVKKMVAQFRPREIKILNCIASEKRGPNRSHTFETLCSPEFQCVENIRIHGMSLYPEDIELRIEDVQHFNHNPQRMVEWVQEQKDKQIAFGLGGVMDRVRVFDLEVRTFTSFPVIDIRKCLENWCAGSNRIEEFSFHHTELANINLNIWEYVCTVQATTVMSSDQLPPVIKAAIEKECFGNEPKAPRVVIRLLTCPTKKKSAYIYMSDWGTIGFRAFDFYPEGNSRFS